MDSFNNPEDPRPRRSRAVPLALAAVGLVGGVLVTGLTANAATTTPATPSATSTAAPADPSAPAAATDPAAAEPAKGTEAPAASAAADQVKAAVLAKYPGATVSLVETDSRGGYEAEIVTAAGASIHVSVSATFVVGDVRGGGHGMGGHSNTDPAHEAAESPAHAAAEKAADAAAAAATPTTTG